MSTASASPTHPSFARLFAPLALLVVAGTVLYGRGETERELARLKSQEALYVGLGAGALARNLEGATTDLRFLAGSRALREAIEGPTPETLDRLAMDFANLARSKGVYDQVRWLDARGQEVVRVDVVEGLPTVVPPAELQDKSRRYFFRDSFRLAPGEVFVSPLDLNVERDRVEEPHRPMIRLATPVADRRGEKRGVLILNYRGADLLEAFAAATAGVADHVALLNGDGYWLRSPRREEEWGFMLGRPDETLATRDPAAWALLRSADAGQARLWSGLWTWQTIHPLLVGQRSSTGAAGGASPSRGAVLPGQYVWKAAAHVPRAALDAVRWAVWRKLAGVAAFLLGLVGLGTFRLARAWETQAAAEEEVRRANAGLERTVAERTEQLHANLVELNQANARLAADVAERRRAEEALRESEAKYRLLFENAEVGMFRAGLEPTGGLEVNEKFLKILGRGREEAPKTPAEIPWADATERDELFRRLDAEGAVKDLECRVLNRQGGVRTCLASLRRDPERRGVDGSLIDITERKWAEETLLRTQRLESLGVLAGGIAHDFNNLLTGILANLSLASADPSAREELLREAEEAARRAQSLTRQLLTFSRGGAPVKSLLELGEVVRDSALFATRGTNATCRCEVAADLWPVEADPGQISQLVHNLVLNAVEASTDGSAVEVSLENLRLEGRRGPLGPGPYVRLRVVDHGVGIPEHLVSRIFDPFFSTKGRGTGLGLSVTHSIAARHGGQVEVHSRPGAGTAFDVFLPARPGERPASAARADLPRELRARVLVMDDEELIRRALARALSSLGCEVDGAAHGEEAVALWERARADGRPFDLAILDLTVRGGMGGVEALARLQALDPGVRAIASSGYSGGPVMADHRRHGFAGALPKPWTAEELSAAVSEVVGSGSAPPGPA
ncbi:MAG TPA: ATP-binding protein [Anaeromyxobacteraceae bacterium]|jgi:PAS domain S-box-containing protein|nr:ATP-binding protein [Anaeromyxobacteraceae bacterium]